MSKQKASKPKKAVMAELRELLCPENIRHDDARAGSALLLGLDDAALHQVFESMCVSKKRQGPLAVIRQFFPSEENGPNAVALVAALRRLSIVGTPLATKMQCAAKDMPAASGSAGRKVAQDSAPVLGANPGLLLDLHIKASKSAKKDLDCMTKMAELVTLLGSQLESLYAYPARQAQPFMGVKSVNMVAQTYMNSLEKLHRMQMDVGIVEKLPEKMEVNLRQAGAFQTYVGELSQEHRQSMIEFADAFCRFAADKAKGVAGDR